jgi:hypothetical protein
MKIFYVMYIVNYIASMEQWRNQEFLLGVIRDYRTASFGAISFEELLGCDRVPLLSFDVRATDLLQ